MIKVRYKALKLIEKYVREDVEAVEVVDELERLGEGALLRELGDELVQK